MHYAASSMYYNYTINIMDGKVYFKIEVSIRPRAMKFNFQLNPLRFTFMHFIFAIITKYSLLYLNN